MDEVLHAAARVGARLMARRETLAVVESSAGGLISGALLAIPGASAFFVGGAVVYTATAREALLGIAPADLRDIRSASEPYALMLARRARERMGTTWALTETGAAGPTGNRYGDAAGHTCFAVAGPVDRTRTLETGADDRWANMRAFAAQALMVLDDVLDPDRARAR